MTTRCRFFQRNLLPGFGLALPLLLIDLLLPCLLPTESQALPHPQPHHHPQPVVSAEGKQNRSLTAGLFIGGRFGEEMSLLAVKKNPLPKSGEERWVLSFGQLSGQPAKGSLPFYQISVQERPSRIVIDIAQVQRTRLETKDIDQMARTSRLVASADFTMDPEDVSTNLTLNLKMPVRLEVFRRSTSGEVVLDLAPLGSSTSVSPP